MSVLWGEGLLTAIARRDLVRELDRELRGPRHVLERLAARGPPRAARVRHTPGLLLALRALLDLLTLQPLPELQAKPSRRRQARGKCRFSRAGGIIGWVKVGGIIGRGKCALGQWGGALRREAHRRGRGRGRCDAGVGEIIGPRGRR